MRENSSGYLWWQEGIVYQVYPRSFQDSNDDGIGDIQGLIDRLDYLQWLGVDIIWLSPVYPSPMKDFGYDISDYTGIHPMFGTHEDFDKLVKDVHNRGMKLIIDLVPNHTSDQHPWFIESRSSRDNPKRNWYIWQDAAPDGNPPNNWLAMFGGNAWEWDEHTGQYYYHAFLKEQPDLNFREPAVQEAMDGIMRYWLNKGVDGFRIDVMWHMIKDKQLRDNPPNPHYNEHMLLYDSLLPIFSTDQPEVHDIVHRMRKVLDEYDHRMMIGEIYLPLDKLIAYYGIDREGAHLPFNFLLLHLPWDAVKVAAIVNEYESALPPDAWPNWVLGNHDQSRLRSRLGLQQARIAAMLLLTLRGTPTLYYGDEIGMQDVPIPFEEMQDPQGLNMPERNLSRDPARTPMQWDNSVYAGFSRARPWLRIDKAYARENVEVEKNDPQSMVNFYKRLIALRQSEPALKYGLYKHVGVDRGGMAYLREYGDSDRFLIVLNFTHKPCSFSFREHYRGFSEVATVPELENIEIEGPIYLSGDEGMVIRLHRDQPAKK
jgi:alpha-glucosidase